MTVYLDMVFGLNLVIDYLLLRGSAVLSGRPVKRLRLLAAALIGGGYAASVFLPHLGWMKNLAMRPVILVLMLLCAFGWRRGTAKQGALFLALAFAFGGLVLLVATLFDTGLVLLHGAAYYPVSFAALILIAGITYLLAALLFSRVAMHGGGEIQSVCVQVGQAQTTLRVLRDTGNTLREPITGQRVLIADWPVIRSLLPPAVSQTVQESWFSAPAEGMQRLGQLLPGWRFRLIPYRAVGVSSGMLLGVCAAAMPVGKKDRQDIVLAFSPTVISDGGGYCGLIGGDVW